MLTPQLPDTQDVPTGLWALLCHILTSVLTPWLRLSAQSRMLATQLCSAGLPMAAFLAYGYIRDLIRTRITPKTQRRWKTYWRTWQK